MRKAVLIALAVGVALLGSATPGTARDTAGKATLKLARPAPLTLVGARFVGGERVRVTVRSDGLRWSKTARATARGRFTVRFSEVALDRCSGLLASAIGSRGSRAGLKAQPYCPHP